MEAGRVERAGELARAAEAMTHVPEHLYQVGGALRARLRDEPAPPPPAGEPVPKTKGFEPKASPPPGRGLGLPPELPPG